MSECGNENKEFALYIKGEEKLFTLLCRNRLVQATAVQGREKTFHCSFTNGMNFMCSLIRFDSG